MGALVRGIAVLVIAIVALVLGYLGLHTFLIYHAGHAFGRSWADTSYYDLQLFLLASAPLNGPGPFPVALQIARVVAPVTTVLAGLEALRLLLGEQIRRWTAAYAPNHAIVTGDGPMAIELARRLRGEFKTVVLAGAKPETADQARQLQLLDIAGDPSDLSTLRAAGIARASVVYACADQSATNAATALRAREFTNMSGRPLLVYALVRDADICTALRARRIGVRSDPGFRLEFFSIEGLAARALLDQHPAADANGQPAHVVIVSFGRLGRAVLYEMALRHEHGRPKVAVTVVGGKQIPAQLFSFVEEFPVVSRTCDVTFQATIPKSEPGTSTLILVCSSENDEALRTGLNALPMLANPDDRLVICMSGLSPFGKTFQENMLDNVQGRLSVFEVLDEACLPVRIRFDLTDQLARAIHRAYLHGSSMRGETPETNSSMRPWHDLPDPLKDANTAQAEHIGTKLDAINCVLVPESDLLPEFSFTDKEVESLAQMEHERWVQERTGHGLVYGPVRDGKHHPDIVDWPELTEKARDKDREVIRAMPGILRQGGFQILRLSPAPE